MVGSDLGGIPEMVIDGRTGELVAPADATSLAASFTRILRSRDLAEAMGRAGREEVDMRFSRERARANWQSILMTSVLARRPR